MWTSKCILLANCRLGTHLMLITQFFKNGWEISDWMFWQSIAECKGSRNRTKKSRCPGPISTKLDLAQFAVKLFYCWKLVDFSQRWSSVDHFWPISTNFKQFYTGYHTLSPLLLPSPLSFLFHSILISLLGIDGISRFVCLLLIFFLIPLLPQSPATSCLSTVNGPWLLRQFVVLRVPGAGVMHFKTRPSEKCLHICRSLLTLEKK
jgi:hypothetical protein